MPSLLINSNKKDPPVDVFNSFFISVTKNLNLHQVGKEDPISF
jgi:hypothetical protein